MATPPTAEQRRPSGQRRIVRAALALSVCAGAACTNPLAFHPSDYAPEARAERLRRIEALELTPATGSDPTDIFQQGPDDASGDHASNVERARAALEAARSRFEGVDRVGVSLEEARASALANNLGLEVALIDPVIAGEAVSEEEGRFDAVFTLSGAWTETDSPTASTLSGSSTRNQQLTPGVRIPLKTGGTAEVRLPVNRFETDNTFSTLNPSISTDLEFSLSHNLLRGAGRRVATHPIRIAQLNRSISETQARLEVVRLLANADRAYWNLYAAVEAREVRYDEYELALEQLDQSNRRFRAGSVAEIEVTRSEAGVAERIEAIIRAHNDVLLRERDLKRLLNVPGLGVDTEQGVLPATDPDPVRYVYDRVGLTDAALDNRAELVEQELRLAIAAANESLARNNALPLFALEYTYRINGLGRTLSDSTDVLGRHNFEDWSVGFQAEVPLGNEERRSQVAQAVLRRLQQAATKADIRQGIVKDVHDAVDTLESSWQRILAARQAVILETRTLQAEQRQFEVGRTTTNDVLDATTRLSVARLREIQAVVDYQIAQVDLAFATGTLLGASRVDWAPLDPRGGPRDTGDAPAYDPASGILPPGWFRPVILDPDRPANTDDGSSDVPSPGRPEREPTTTPVESAGDALPSETPNGTPGASE